MKHKAQKLDYYAAIFGCAACGFGTIAFSLVILLLEASGVTHVRSYDPGVVLVIRLLLFGLLPTLAAALLGGSLTMWRFRKSVAFS